MKSFKSILAIVALAVAIPFSASGEEGKKKERKIKGTLACAKCALKKTDSCQAALTINRKSKDGKEIKRVFLLKNNDVAKGFHSNICSGDKVPVAVTGIREGKGKKATIVASKIEKAKKKKA
tara:strand:- start:1220 stop:1585 length:366 start_codon:yes stop_codon:yes gene_type:complete